MGQKDSKISIGVAGSQKLAKPDLMNFQQEKLVEKYYSTIVKNAHTEKILINFGKTHDLNYKLSFIYHALIDKPQHKEYIDSKLAFFYYFYYAADNAP